MDEGVRTLDIWGNNAKKSHLDGVLERIAVYTISADSFDTDELPPQYRTENGVAIIPIRGVLLKRPGVIQTLLGASSSR